MVVHWEMGINTNKKAPQRIEAKRYLRSFISRIFAVNLLDMWLRQALLLLVHITLKYARAKRKPILRLNVGYQMIDNTFGALTFS